MLNDSEKDHLENLQSAIQVWRLPDQPTDFPNQYMAEITKAVSHKQVIEIEYVSSKNNELTRRKVEPIGIVHYSGRWHLISFCRLRNGYRDFRVDMIRTLTTTGEIFDSRNLFTLQEYFQSLMQAHREMQKAVVVFDHSIAKYLRNAKYYYGFVSEEDTPEGVRMTFLVGSLNYFCRWLLSYGTKVELEAPDELREMMDKVLDELNMHYKAGVLK